MAKGNKPTRMPMTGCGYAKGGPVGSPTKAKSKKNVKVPAPSKMSMLLGYK